MYATMKQRRDWNRLSATSVPRTRGLCRRWRTKSYLWMCSLGSPFETVSRHRDLLITIWYPSHGGSGIAPYMDRKTGAAIADDWKLPSNFADRVQTNAKLGAPIEKGAFPLVLLEHGSGVVPAIYTCLAEGLASHGFIVAATNHPPDSLIAVFPDGHELRSQPYWPLDADRRTQGVAIGNFADEVLVPDVRFVPLGWVNRCSLLRQKNMPLIPKLGRGNTPGASRILITSSFQVVITSVLPTSD